MELKDFNRIGNSRSLIEVEESPPTHRDWPRRQIGIERIRRYETIEEVLSNREKFKDVLTFTNRSEYLLWVHDWQTLYKQLSAEQRFLKTETRGRFANL